jgi:hypothetical protein
MTRHELPDGSWDDYDPAKGCCLGVLIGSVMIAIIIWLFL